MSSSISSSDPHQRSVLWLLALVLLPIVGLFALGVHVQPLNGDLTRAGFFAEREFGWNDPQVEFPDTRLEFPKSWRTDPGHLAMYHDIVVLGDSFTHGNPRRQWQNYLAAATGWSVATQNIIVVRLSEVLASPVFRDHPPRYLIVGSVERELTQHLKRNVPGCEAAIAPLYRTGVGAETLAARSVDWDVILSGMTARVERPMEWRDINLDFVRGYVWNTLARKFVPGRANSSWQVQLSPPAPFSSRDKETMLVFRDDFKKVDWWRSVGLNELDCSIDEMRRQVEANGFTRFVLMVPPDKLTAYAEFLSDAKLKGTSLLSSLSERHPDVMPRFDRNLIEAIRRGEQDVYLPNDTHWGSNGHRVAAETLLRFLTRPQPALSPIQN